MTTNVFDVLNGLICTDSRWSCKLGRWLVYVDDVHYHKIEPRGGHVAMFAGDGLRIDAWKQWMRMPQLDCDDMPATDGVALCLIRCEDREVVFHEGVDIKAAGAIFAGSGSGTAADCWLRNRCANTAVASAIAIDPQSGGGTKFFNVSSGDHNLFPPVPQKLATFAELQNALRLKGTIMDMATKTNAKFSMAQLSLRAASRDAEDDLTQLIQRVEAGTLQPSAPCDAMYNGAWSAERVAACKDAFRAAFG